MKAGWGIGIRVLDTLYSHDLAQRTAIITSFIHCLINSSFPFSFPHAISPRERRERPWVVSHVIALL